MHPHDVIGRYVSGSKILEGTLSGCLNFNFLVLGTIVSKYVRYLSTKIKIESGQFP